MDDWAPDIPQTVRSELPPFGIKPHWVTFGFSTPANRLYDLYNAHVDRSRGDLVVWPTLDELAKMMGLSRGDKVTPYMRELEAGGAVSVQTVTKTGGKGRRYIVTLKVHPPAGFTGPMQTSDWYDIHRASQPGKTTMADRARPGRGEPAGDEVPPPEGVYVGPQEGDDVHPPQGGVTKNHSNQNQEKNETAPSARSAADARRASAGSSAREAGSGFAATEKTGSATGDGEALEAAGEPRKVPQQRGKGRKASPFPRDLRERIYATEELLPPLLRGLLLEMFPYGHLPNENRKVIAQALEFRTPEQLGERAARRWITYGYDRDYYDGGIRNPLGVVEELVRPTPYCPDPECEDQTKPCVPCTERNARRARDYRAGRPVATHRPPRLYLHREECDVCQRPLPAEVPEDRRCGQCRTEMERANARLLGTPDDHETDQDDDPDAAYAPAPPNAEYRRQRERQAAAKGAPF
ncbi:hypothetical protein [Streptomyces sp. enrichment culture]|uniref:hypothetical protein n=1 Tax=Streptomyces sp. enrichment culture TaxID=1795815 RepID=UPI003F5581A5